MGRKFGNALEKVVLEAYLRKVETKNLVQYPQ